MSRPWSEAQPSDPARGAQASGGMVMTITGRTRLAGVLGWPVLHSRSPAMHNAAYAALGIDAVYVPLAVPPERLAAALAGLRALGFMGANLTVPHKTEAARGCDRVADVARRAGAVNTVVVEADGTLVGHNTDVGGFADALAEVAPPDGRQVVLGAGGAARAVVMALAERKGGDAEIDVVARDRHKAEALRPLGATRVCGWTREDLGRVLGGAAVIVDATSAALDEASERAMLADLPVEAIAAETLVCSLVYHREPALLRAARAAGARTLDGGPMLVHQAARAFALMTGRTASVEVMRAAFLAAAG